MANRPSISSIPATLAYRRGDDPVLLAPNLIVTDTHSSTLAHATVRLRGNYDDPLGDALTADVSGTSISAFYDAPNATLILSGIDSIAHYQQVMRSVLYSWSGEPTERPTASRDIEWQADDGSGWAGFGSPASISLGASTVRTDAVLAADVNGDGRDDLFVGGPLLLLNHGNGTFDAPLQTWFMPSSVADLNGDGIVDIVSAAVDNGIRLVKTALGNGDGTFRTPVSHPADWIAPATPDPTGVADLSNDGKIDIVTTRSILIGNGDGTFSAAQPIASDDNVKNVVVADVNGDGRADLILGHSDGSTQFYVTVWKGNGDGTFQSPLRSELPSRTNADTNMSVADVNGDGRVDVVVTSVDSTGVLLGAGDGTFAPPLLNGGITRPIRTAVGDVNGDGLADIVIAGGDAGHEDSVRVLLGGTNSYLLYHTGVSAGSSPRRLVLGDFDGVGGPDLAVIGNGRTGSEFGFTVVLNAGTSTSDAAHTSLTLDWGPNLYAWSALADAQVLPFDPAVDRIVFDDASISAADVSLQGTLLQLSHQAKTVTFGSDFRAVTTTNVSFSDGSVLLVGDNTTGTTLDDGANTLTGGTGNDQLYGAGGDDTLLGGAGDDLLVGGAGGDMLNGGDGNDTVSYAGSDARVFARLWVGDAWNGDGWRGTGAGDVLVSIENLVGSDHADWFEASDLVGSTLDGRAGNDTLLGRSHDDRLLGGTGDDVLLGGAGNDLMIGGPGADVLDGQEGDADIASYAGSPSRVFARLWVGDAWGGDAANGQGATDTLVRVEGLVGSGNADWLEGLLDARSTLVGGADDDALFGFGGDDLIDAGPGNDWLRGGAGGDRLDGGDGNDTVSYEGSDARVFARLWVGDAWNGDGWRGPGDADVLVSIENLVGSDYADWFEGDAGANRLDGRAGDDTLFGREGPDVFVGGEGRDLLFGGAGADVFVYRSTSEGVDTIADFERGPGNDQLLLEHVLVGYVPGLSSIANFVALRESGANTTLSVNADGMGNDFVDLLVFQGQIGLVLNALLADGNLVIA